MRNQLEIGFGTAVIYATSTLKPMEIAKQKTWKVKKLSGESTVWESYEQEEMKILSFFRNEEDLQN